MTYCSILAMWRYSIESRTRKYVKGYEFLSLVRNSSNKYIKKIIECRSRCCKNCFQKSSSENR